MHPVRKRKRKSIAPTRLEHSLELNTPVGGARIGLVPKMPAVTMPSIYGVGNHHDVYGQGRQPQQHEGRAFFKSSSRDLYACRRHDTDPAGADRYNSVATIDPQAFQKTSTIVYFKCNIDNIVHNKFATIVL